MDVSLACSSGKNFAQNLVGTAAGVGVGVGATVGLMCLGPVGWVAWTGVVAGGVVAGVVGGVTGGFIGGGIDGLIFSVDDDMAAHAYEFFGFSAARGKRPIFENDAVVAAYKKRQKEKETEEWLSLVDRTAMQLINSMYPELPELRAMGADLKERWKDTPPEAQQLAAALTSTELAAGDA